MKTKILLDKTQTYYQKLRNLFYGRVFTAGHSREADEELVETLINTNTQYVGLMITPTAYGPSTQYAILPTDGTGDGTVVRNSIGTRINEIGLIETIAANVPRINWSDGKPSILLESEATCLTLNSEDISEVSYIKSSTTVTTNTDISPAGTLTADTLTNSPGLLGSVINAPLVPADTVTRTVSIFIKKTATDQFSVFGFRYQSGTPVGTSLQLNLRTGDFVSPVPIGGFFGAAAIAKGVQDYGDYWRVYLTFANNGTNTQIYSFIQYSRGTALSDFTVLDGSATVWGWNITEGLLSSYIPTSGSTVKREADQMTNFGDVDTFNSEEFTFFVDFRALVNNGEDRRISLSNGTGDFRLVVYFHPDDRIRVLVKNDTSAITHTLFSPLLTDITQFNKVAVRVKEDDISFYLNGIEIGSFASWTPFLTNTLDTLNFSSNDGTAGFFEGEIKNLQVINKGLTNIELAEITS
jgi:hypothetical protein